MIIDKLQLVTGVDLDIPKHGIRIHQPTVEEIAFIGEKKFFSVLEIIVVDLDELRLNYFNNTQEDKTDIFTSSDEQLFISLLISDADTFTTFLHLVYLANPDIQIELKQDRLFFFLKVHSEDSETPRLSMLDPIFLMDLREIFRKMFKTDFFFPKTKTDEFNPIGGKANEIAEKIRSQREKVNKQKSSGIRIESLLGLLVSMLAVSSSSLTLDTITNYTIYKLVNQFERDKLFKEYGQSLSAIYAGAKNVEIVDWTKDI